MIVKTGVLHLRADVSSILSITQSIIGSNLTIQRGFSSSTERYIFRGEVISFKQKGSLYEINYADKLYVASRRIYDYTFDINIDTEAGIGSEIVKTLFDYCGINYTSSTITSTGTTSGKTMKKYPAKGKIIEILKDLANMYNYQVFYDDDSDNGYFIPKGSTLTSTKLDTQNHIVNRIQWNNTAEDMVNSLTVVGGQQLDWNTETFSGDDSTTVFTLDAKPVETDITVGGTKVYRGVDSSNTKDFLVDYDNKTITFTTAPTTGTDNIVIDYSYYVPVKVTTSDYSSIADFNQHDDYLPNERLLNTDDAELFSNSYISEQSQPLTNAPLAVISNNDLEPGQEIVIEDYINNVTKSVIVQNIRYRYPFKPDEVDVGKIEQQPADAELKVIEAVVKLQRQLSSQTEIDLFNIYAEKILEISGYNKIENATADENGFYLDSNLGFIGYNFTNPQNDYSITSLIPINNSIYEDFRSTEFEDSGNTTATWNTDGTCTFTSGQVAQSDYYLKDIDSSVNTITLEADYTGYLDFAISTDGTNWESITNLTTINSSYNGNYIYWKATEGASSTATLNSIKIIYTVI